MTKMQVLDENYENDSHKIIEEVSEGKKKLKELGFENTVSAELFKEVFSFYCTYSINEIRLMSVDFRESQNKYLMQFLVQFEDDSQAFVYVEVK